MRLSSGAAIRRHRGASAAFMTLCVAGVIASFMMQDRALDAERAHAQGRARAVANEVDGALGTTQLHRSIEASAEAQLQSRLRHALKGESILAVRVWTPTGVMRYSSLARDRSKPLAEALLTATKGIGLIVSEIDAEVMTTYVPLRDGPGGEPFGAVEVQQPYRPVVEAAATPWSQIRLGAGALALLMVLLLVLGVLAEIAVRRNARAGAGFVSGVQHDVEPLGAVVPVQPVGTVAPIEPAAPVPEAQPARRATGSEGVTRAAEVPELERLRAELDSLRRRTGARITELQDELDRTRIQLKEARAAAPPAEGPSAAERMSGLREQLQAESLRAGTAMARIKGLEAQAKLQETKIAELTASLRELGSDASRAVG